MIVKDNIYIFIDLGEVLRGLLSRSRGSALGSRGGL